MIISSLLISFSNFIFTNCVQHANDQRAVFSLQKIEHPFINFKVFNKTNHIFKIYSERFYFNTVNCDVSV